MDTFTIRRSDKHHPTQNETTILIMYKFFLKTAESGRKC